MPGRTPPGRDRWLATLLLLGAMAAGARPAAAADDAPRPPAPQAGSTVRDLYYGEALFQFYRQDDFAALTHLLAAREAGRVSRHEAESELLLGGLYLSYGQHERAAGIFGRLLGDDSAPAVRDRAWFYLGKLRYQRGLHTEALAAFARVGRDLPAALAGELPMHVAQCHMALGDYAAASRVLGEWEAEDGWAAYARYNLGVALVRLDRMEEGAALLDRVGRMDAATDVEKSLRDKANVALGYAWLQRDDAERARGALSRVRLKGAFASKALLGAGWADALAGDYGAALVPWLELVDRDLLDGAVQEAFLAVPYAFGRMQAHGSAVARYREALGLFDRELGNLDRAIDRARTGELLPALLAGDDAELGRWYWRLEQLPGSDDSRYLYHLLADHRFQEGFKNYRDLSILDQHLEDWEQRLDAYSGMVDARRSAFEARAPQAERAAGEVAHDSIRARRDALAGRLAGARENRDIVALATTEQAGQWQRLLAVEGDPQFAAAAADVRARHRILKGVLAWDLDRQFRQRLHAGERELRALDRAIDGTSARVAALRGARGEEPRRFDDFAARIAALRPRVAAMRTAVAATRASQESSLVALAVGELEERKQRLASYQVQARFALATIFDRAGAKQAAAGDAP